MTSNMAQEWQQSLIRTMITYLLKIKVWRDLIRTGRTLSITICPSSGILPDVERLIVTAPSYPQVQITTIRQNP